MYATLEYTMNTIFYIAYIRNVHILNVSFIFEYSMNNLLSLRIYRTFRLQTKYFMNI